MNIQQELDTRVGFAIPLPLVKIVTAFVQRVGDFDGGVQLLEDYVGARICESMKCRYESTPLEFFPIFDTGGDGVMYGYVVHTPELALTDRPMGVYAPLDAGIAHVGNSTVSAIENLISYCHSDDGDSQLDVDLLGQLGIFPSPDKRDEVWKLDGESRVPLKPELPSGWRHVLTSDGIGVVAEERLFRPGEAQQLPPKSSIADYLAQARADMNGGFVGDALVTLKEAWSDRNHLGEQLNQLRNDLGEAYAKIGKPTLKTALETQFGWDLDEDARIKALLWRRATKL